LLALVALDPMRAPLTHLASGETLRALAEGPAGIVTVADTGDDLQLRLDNYYVLGGSAAATNERRQGLLPLLLHPAPHRVAFVGMATGITASAGPALDVERTFLGVFPEVSLWRNDFYPDRPVVGLVGRLAPGAVDLDRVGERLRALPAWSRDPLLATPQGLAMLSLGNLAAARELIANGP